MKVSVGFIGLGLMGTPLAHRFLKSGYPMTVFNRTKGKAKELLHGGAKWADSPRQVAERSEVMFSMLSTSEVLEETALGEDGILRGIRKNAVHVDMSTVSPVLTEKLAQEYASARAHFLHSPVLGSVPQATEGTLLLFVGGDEEAYRRVGPLLKIAGREIWRFERVEQATHTKIICNSFISGMIAILVQGLVSSQKAGIGGSTLLDILSHSGFNSQMYQSKGKAILDRNFAPRFYVEHMLKDVNLMIESGRLLGTPTPVADAALQLFEETVKGGWGKEDYSAVIKVLERRAGVEVQAN